MKLKVRVISLLLVSILSATLWGCNKNKNQPQEYDNEDYTIAGNSSYGEVIETQNGIYRITSTKMGKYVMYADKPDLSNWVYLCSKANCKHDSYDCNGYIGGGMGGVIFLHDNHIYYVDNPEIYAMDMDGSNHERIRTIPNANKPTNNLQLYWNNKYILSQSQYSEEEMGIVKKYIYEVSFEEKEADKVLYEYEGEGDIFPPTGLSYGKNNYSGKFLIAVNFHTESLENRMIHEYDLTKDSLIPVEANAVYEYPAYFKENTAYYYKWNEGFFIKDMNSGKEEKLLDPIAKDSRASITKDYFIQGSGYTYDKKGDGWITIYNLEGDVLEKIDLKTDEDSYYMGEFKFETSDRLFFSVVKLDGSEDCYYILKENIGSKKNQYIYSYTNEISYLYVDPEKQ